MLFLSVIKSQLNAFTWHPRWASPSLDGLLNKNQQTCVFWWIHANHCVNLHFRHRFKLYPPCISAYFLKYNNTLVYPFTKATQKPNSSLKRWLHAFPSISVCLHGYGCVSEQDEKRAREREREGVLTGRKRAKVQAAHVSGSTSPLCARWKTWHSHRFLQPGLAPHLSRRSFLAGAAIFISSMEKFM